MKSIKFRAWDKVRKEMFYVLSIGLSVLNGRDKNIEANNGIITTIIPEQNYILMQFTGLKDIEGKEIYEGDILARKNKECDVVVWDKGAFCVRHKNKSMDFIASPNYFSIVGNVHEHPHLLKERET